MGSWKVVFLGQQGKYLLNLSAENEIAERGIIKK